MTKTAQHTPGPWEVERIALSIPAEDHQDHILWIGDSNHTSICDLYYRDRDADGELEMWAFKNHEANANMISASPALLVALKGLRRSTFVSHPDGQKSLEKYIDLADAAIAKAESRDDG